MSSSRIASKRSSRLSLWRQPTEIEGGQVLLPRQLRFLHQSLQAPLVALLALQCRQGQQVRRMRLPLAVGLLHDPHLVLAREAPPPGHRHHLRVGGCENLAPREAAPPATAPSPPPRSRPSE